jgi:hypothetical protein
MHKIILLAIVAASITLLPMVGRTDPFYLGGIQVNEPDPEKWVQTLKRERLNTIAVTTYSYQADWNTDQLTFKKENQGLVNEIRAAKANGLHVVLILRTALDHAYPQNKFLWHGLIMPRTDKALESWFEKYTEFVLHWATIAQQEEINVLGIASEMNALTSTLPVDGVPKLQDWYLDRIKQQKRKGRLLNHSDVIEERHLWVRGHKNYSTYETFLDDRQLAYEVWARQTAFFDDENPVLRINERRQKLDRLWRELIARIRGVYQGKLTYSANFDQYFEVGFWDALDLMSINAYFPLRNDLLEKDQEHLLEGLLIKGWQRVFGEIDAFYRKRNLRNMPILFSELGYTRRKNCTIEPWADTGFSLIGSSSDKKFVIWRDQPERPLERALAVKSLHHVTRNRRQNPLMGILYWKLSTVPSHVDIEQFVCILGEDTADELLRSLQLFTADRNYESGHYYLDINMGKDDG